MTAPDTGGTFIFVSTAYFSKLQVCHTVQRTIKEKYTKTVEEFCRWISSCPTKTINT